MGLPLYFSSCMYRKDQLNKLEGPAAEFARRQYPSIDEIASTFKKIHASSKDKLKAELNIDDEYIFNYHGENTAFYIDIDIFLQDILNLQVENSEINGEVIKIQRIENLINLIENDQILEKLERPRKFRAKEFFFTHFKRLRILNEISAPTCKMYLERSSKP